MGPSRDPATRWPIEGILMLIIVAVIIGLVCFWELLEGMGLVAWGLIEIARQIMGR